ncbi:1-(5-phosphoribosyl)-5-[(5-phosphoribosylamino)methylideneamino]imidazole-4-carboxamide isomerase [Haliovirga abyssi]|uniref:1-(5-phosphoribosyl)-5-[(5-phosphoribosylamino)methylideneamino] imidazole-4-carboxamide isomerase n=1 Tax=Haliovirga abyssi TaxID=2996794 RepID=A0AAU9E0P3_9FUSO|nr:1-(5-phosphoribosyl)-5-[(5-phosphoribosylamino)methylideneamino]imidazole-4-carboxamide isomerase [Haliovirga abyssi]BDU51485.1 1-(5-phosphoribosyl)-5-[(5-phosphoribosylamino) methylideneamino] imidazole-4-carboxamide isomerase [Haliovirga abyssi]
MKIFPAIDIRNGKCVRLTQGDYKKETIFFDNPVEVAKRFEEEGAGFIHLVDLDGALEGELKNRELIRDIVNNINIPVELGGGIRDLFRIEELLKLGVSRVILGTIAIKKPEIVKEAVEKFGAEKIVIGIDAKDGKVAITGWTEITKKDSIEFIKDMEKLGVKTVIYTDISKDGMLEGINLDIMKKILEETKINLVASGGVGTINDIIELNKLENEKLEGVIVGKAIYENRLNLKEVIKYLEMAQK